MKLNLREMAAAEDQRAAILAATAKAVSGLELLRNRVLVATYVIPEKTKGGIIRIDRTIEESRFQGKVGLVLAKGPEAFNFEDKNPGVVPEVGDWVFYRAADSSELGIAGLGENSGLSCRWIYDDHIVGRVADPESIW